MTSAVTCSDFEKWFSKATGYAGPQTWQSELARSNDCSNRLIRIPTGLGKTLGVLSTWLFHRVERLDNNWPRRLVWCLPMRTLVEQTVAEAQKIIEKAGLKELVDVRRLLGGVEESEWYANPEREAILVGTQDMLLSRALNRGYAMGRAAWPRAFGLINCDALWVMDEVQLMGVGLTTGSQIQAFWEHRNIKGDSRILLPRATWWMSATLQPDWLRSPETAPMVEELSTDTLRIEERDRKGKVWEAKKSLSIQAIDPKEAAELVAATHAAHAADTKTGRQTLVVVNRVQTAKELFLSLKKQFKKSDSAAELRLVHSRFRPFDRVNWVADFLSRESLGPEVNRIVVATQVVEAGVDISASCLITELAPWTSLVQRFGRAARYGGNAQIIVLDANPTDEKKSAPYALAELNSAREALKEIDDVAIRSLEEFEDRLQKDDPARLAELYPFQPLHVLLAHEFDELFDTSTDLSGADMDVSRFIREGDERDLHVFWRNFVDHTPSREIQPHRDELCAVPIGEAKAWVKKLNENKGVVFHWDYLEGKWTNVRPENLRPGMTLLVLAGAGGYDLEVGFTGDKPGKDSSNLDITPQIQNAETPRSSIADRSDSSESLSQVAQWKTIFTHCREAGEEANKLATDLKLDEKLRAILGLAMRIHDWGKSHPAFATGTYRVSPVRVDLAKAPAEAWQPSQKLYQTQTHGHRRGFRHELASCLATLELLRRALPDHPAVATDHLDWFEDLTPSNIDTPAITNALADEIARLDQLDVDLLLYLVAAHHGKVRVSMQATPKDQSFDFDNSNFVGKGMPVRGVRERDVIPETRLPDEHGSPVIVPELKVSLTPAAMGLSERYGRSWSERTLTLIDKVGPFTLGYLEAIVRAADVRASVLATEDPELAGISFTIPETIALAENAEDEIDINDDHESEIEPELVEAEIEDTND
jgi:CRISPR-associated endonuclease/helicase Cas3